MYLVLQCLAKSRCYMTERLSEDLWRMCRMSCSLSRSYPCICLKQLIKFTANLRTQTKHLPKHNRIQTTKSHALDILFVQMGVHCKDHFTLIYSISRGQRLIWSQGLYRHWYVKPINPDKNQPQQQRRLCRQMLLPRPRRLRPRDPWATQQKLQQTGEGAGESPSP